MTLAQRHPSRAGWLLAALSVLMTACSGSRPASDLDNPDVLLGHLNHVVVTSVYQPKNTGFSRARTRPLVEDDHYRRSVFGKKPLAQVADNRYNNQPRAVAEQLPQDRQAIAPPSAVTLVQNNQMPAREQSVAQARQGASSTVAQTSARQAAVNSPRQVAAPRPNVPAASASQQGNNIRLPTVRDILKPAPASQPASLRKRPAPYQQQLAQQKVPAKYQRAAYTPRPQPANASRAIAASPAAANAWADIIKGYQLSASLDKRRVQAYLDYYRKRPKQINVLSQRAAVFLPMIMAEVREARLPSELALLPFVESGFLLKAQSPAGAAGLWQFIPATGRRYGLQQNASYDGRLNAHTSTKAALAYLKDLHQEFDDWFLALAAYNCGEECVRRAVAENMKAGKAIDFWSLSLPKETRNYVPRLLAYREIVSQPAQYGIQLHPGNQFVQLDSMPIDKPVSLEKLSTVAGIQQKNLLQRLNPGFKNGVVTPSYDNRILVPVKYLKRVGDVLSGTLLAN